MSEDWKLKRKDVVMLLLPIEGEEKYIVAKWVVTDKLVETLKDAIIELPESEGKGKLKYPVVLVRDIDKLRAKVINDIKELRPITDCDDNSDYIDGFYQGYESAQLDSKMIICKRFEED